MLDNPFFSIIIPVYNAADYLDDCLQSVVNQKFQDWEAIIVDDNSSDDSVEIIRRYAQEDPRIKLFTSTENSGGAHTPRMRAANLAASDVLVIIDADDKVSDDLLAQHYRKISDTSADLVIPEMWRLTDSESYKVLPLDSIDVSKSWIGKELVNRTLRKWEIPMAGFAVRRNLYLEANGKLSHDEKKSIFADELLSRWILYLCKRVTFDMSRYYYRYNAESVTHTDVSRFIDSKMATCDALISMTANVFGELSPTHLGALDNKFISVVDALRLVNNTKLSAEQKSHVLNRLKSAMSNFDLSLLKGRISSRYIALMSLPLPLARYSLKTIDFLLKTK